MSSSGVTLNEVAAAIGAAVVDVDTWVSAVHHDTRRVEPESLFVAVVGARTDGHDLVADAAAAGAVAAAVERPVDVPIPQLVVADSRAVLATASACVYGYPADRLDLIGVTGTNGKTTVTHFLEAIAEAAGKTAGVVGTLGARIGGEPVALERTTPEANRVQQLLATMVEAEVTVAALEVSSHALALHRVDAMRFDVAAFTNLSQDHLDFHHSMEEYFAVKADLFTKERAAHGVVFVDDPWGQRLAESATIPITTVGADRTCDVWFSDVDCVADDTSFVLHAGDREQPIHLALPGRFNVANAAVAAAAALRIGIGLTAVAAGLAGITAIPGRFEVVRGPVPFTVVVDYAHTPEAIEAVIAEARSIVDGRVIVLVGAGGDRDRDKRPLMGAAAATADLAILTTDNPRSEDPTAILDEVVAGATRQSASIPVVAEVDRRIAIRKSLQAAEPHDAVLILGKGHEQGQEFADGRVEAFDDRLVASEEMAVLAGVGPA